MSTDVKPVDEGQLMAAIQKLRGDESGVAGSYIIIGHVNGNPNEIDVIAEGNGGCSELVTHLDDTQVMYILLRLEEVVDMSTTVKFMYIHWVGMKTPFTKRGRYGVVQGSVIQFLNPYHASTEYDNIDDITDDAIKAIISESSGTKSKVLDETDSSALRQHRGFTSVPVSKPPKVSSAVPAVSKKGADVTFNPEVPTGIADVRDDGTNTNWVLVGYEDKDLKKPLTLIRSGSEGVNELTALLEDDAVMYGLYRVTDVIDQHSTVKFVYITWVGDNVKPMSKGKIATHKGAVEELFYPSHLALFATSRRELTAEGILDKVMATSGSKSHVKTSE